MIQTARPPAAREGKLDKTRVTRATATDGGEKRKTWTERPRKSQERDDNHNQDRGEAEEGQSQERGKCSS